MQATRIDKRKALLEIREKEKRIKVFGIIFTFLLVLLTARLYFIQVLNGEELVNRVKQQQNNQIALEGKSGNITDRNGISFTSAGEDWLLKVIPYTIGFDVQAYDVVEILTGKNPSYLKSNLTETYNLPIINPNSELLAAIKENKYPGVLCYKENIRYNDHSLARHVVGYLRKSDNIPMAGIEKIFSKYLHPGMESYVNVFSDATNRPLFSLGYQIKEPEREWYDVQLTLDYDIQKILEQVLDRYPGRRHGGIVVDAESGEILALASRPHYKQHTPYAEKTDGMDSSFLAIPLEQYPFGSVFKIIVAAAALESGKFDEDSNFTCSGGINVGNRWIPCHTSMGGLGSITLREAFAYSCNDTFIQIAQEIGGEAIVNTAKSFGLGRPVNIELPNATGCIMEKSEYIGTGIANLALGQGKIMVSPLQAADMLATILNGGIRSSLKLVNGLVGSEGHVIDDNLKDVADINHRVVSQQTASKLMEWMGDVTEYGTAKNIDDFFIKGAAGKTGTPQVSDDMNSNNFGWFAGFFPKDNPKYIVVVLSLEEGGAAEMAVPVFQDIANDIWLNTVN